MRTSLDPVVLSWRTSCPSDDWAAEHVPVHVEFADEYCAARDVEATRMLNPDLRSFDSWLEAIHNAFRADVAAIDEAALAAGRGAPGLAVAEVADR